MHIKCVLNSKYLQECKRGADHLLFWGYAVYQLYCSQLHALWCQQLQALWWSIEQKQGILNISAPNSYPWSTYKHFELNKY